MRAFSLRLLLVLLAAAAALAVVLGASRTSSPTHRVDTKPLNVVVILSDDERVDGSAVMHNVHRLLMDHGITFTNYHVTTSECGPSRASILTGLYSHHNGVLDNFGLHSYPAFNQESNLPVWLHRAGYDTALIGKFLNDYTLYGHNKIPPGWTDFQAMDSIPMEKYYNYSINDNGTLEHYGTKPSDYSTTVLTNKATQFISRAKKPFFLYFAPVAPHLPSIPAPQDRGKLVNIAPLHTPSIDEQNIRDKPWREWHKDLLKAAADVYQNHVRQRQLESLLALDRSVKSIVTALEQRKLLDHTVIIYSSDNGFLYGEHRLGGKLWPYEESTHVPLIVRAPWTHRASKSAAAVLNIDLAPTISRLAGIDPGTPEDGRSFVPMLHLKKIHWRNAYVLEYLGRNQLRFGGPPAYSAVHTKRYLYIEYQNGWRELYDLRHDPWELNNLARLPRYATLRSDLHGVLKRLDALPPKRSRL